MMQLAVNAKAHLQPLLVAQCQQVGAVNHTRADGLHKAVVLDVYLAGLQGVAAAGRCLCRRQRHNHSSLCVFGREDGSGINQLVSITWPIAALWTVTASSSNQDSQSACG